MFKKLAIVGAAVVAGVLILNMTVAGSYVSTAWKKVRAKASSQVPLEFELERVRNEVSKLVPDMKDNIKSIAEEMVAVERLRDDIKVTRAELDKQKDNILTMKHDVETAGTAKTISYKGTAYSVSRVKDKLARDWESYKRGEESVATKEKLLDAKENNLGLAREQLATIRQKKEQLEVEIAKIEADLKNVRVAQTRSNYQFDDSRLARINASLAAIRDRMNVEVKEQELRGTFASDLEIKVEKTVKTADVLREIDSHFGDVEKNVAEGK